MDAKTAQDLSLQAYPIDERYNDAGRKLLQYTLAAAGGGAALRGLQGLKRLIWPQQQPGGLNEPQALQLPPRRGDDEEEKSPARKVAAADAPAAQGPTTFADVIPDSWKADVTNPLRHHPLGIPALIGGVGAGGYGGYKLVDWLLDKQRTSNEQERLEKAKRDYEAALASQFKNAGDRESIGALSEKTAFDWQSIKDKLGAGAGAYLALLAGTGLGAGKLTYDWQRGRQTEKQRALEEEKRKRMRRTPPPLFAIAPNQG